MAPFWPWVILRAGRPLSLIVVQIAAEPCETRLLDDFRVDISGRQREAK
jgi:hypothetical protein